MEPWEGGEGGGRGGTGREARQRKGDGAKGKIYVYAEQAKGKCAILNCSQKS